MRMWFERSVAFRKISDQSHLQIIYPKQCSYLVLKLYLSLRVYKDTYFSLNYVSF